MAELDIDIDVDDVSVSGPPPDLTRALTFAARAEGLPSSGIKKAVDCDYKGRPFSLPVDAEHKACSLKINSFAKPHMAAFHLSWISFFTSFVAVFAAVPMVPVLREDLDLTQLTIGIAGITAVTGTVFCRVVIGMICDAVGPRLGCAVLLLTTAPAVFCMAIVKDAFGYIAVRLFIGFSLSTFVSCQFWCSVMFTPGVIGIANATAAGWGNLGGGITQLLMPLIFAGLKTTTEPFLAWRWAFFVPASAMLLAGAGCLTLGQDLPDGQYAELKKVGMLPKASILHSTLAACKNYRTWILAINYGFCFGVELTMQNLLTPYFYDQFGLPLSIAGLLGSLFGLMNLFARTLGGFASDRIALRHGMRGRLWACWTLQTLEGFFCIILGLVYRSLAVTVILLVCFSLCVQAAEGACFAVVPFVSKRGLGLVNGLVGAGGSTGSVLTQTLFFARGNFETHTGIILMGVSIIAVTQTFCLIWFPMWGGMLSEPVEGTHEHDYYAKEFSRHEKAGGFQMAVLRFANSSASSRAPSRLPSFCSPPVHPGDAPPAQKDSLMPGTHLDIDIS